MATWFVKSGSGTPNSGTYRGYFANSTTWAVGDRVYPSIGYATAAARGYCYECTTGGAGGASEPTWVYTTPDTSTTTSGAAVFTCRNPDDWTDACIDLQGGGARCTAGDTVYVADTHAESQTAAATYLIAIPTGLPRTSVFCVTPSGASGVSGLATGGTVTKSGGTLQLSGNYYMYGLRFEHGTGSANQSMIVQMGEAGELDTCTIHSATDYNGTVVTVNNSYVMSSRLKNCTFSRVARGGGYSVNANVLAATAGETIIEGGSATWASGAGFQCNGVGRLTVSGFDLSSMQSSGNIFSVSSSVGTVRNCKLPSSWSGILQNVGSNQNGQAFLHNCDSTDTNYRFEHATVLARTLYETTLVRSGGANDGATAISWKIVTTTYPRFVVPYIAPEIVRWNETTGSAITATVEILHDSATNLTDAEVWLECMYLGTSGVPLGTWTSDRAADILATPADQATSSETWTTTGMTNPNTQKLSVTITPAEKGFIHARVCVAKASKTLYVDPKLEVSY